MVSHVERIVIIGNIVEKKEVLSKHWRSCFEKKEKAL